MGEKSAVFHAAILVVATLVVVRLMQKKKKKTTTFRHEDCSSTRLNDFEQKCLKYYHFAPIATITWITGDHDQATSIVKKRLHSLLKCNPWILGYFVFRNNQGYIEYPKTPPNDDTISKDFIDAFFVHKQIPIKGFHRHTAFGKIETILAKSGAILEQQKEMSQPFVKVAVIPCVADPEKRFAVVLSMSHVVADGHTYYRIYNALMSSVGHYPALDVRRIATTTQQQKHALGKPEYDIFRGIFVRMIGGVLYDFIMWPFCKESLKMESHYFLVDSVKLKQLKEEAVSLDNSAPFVSSNDVITSWFLQNSSGQNGAMAINFRNRLEGHTDNHAGNYENCLWYRPEDSKSPTLIRRSLWSLKRAESYATPPTFWELASGDLSLISNWSTFANCNFNLGAGFKQELHMPLLYPEGKLRLSTRAICVIFEATHGQLGVCYICSRGHAKNLLGCPFQLNRLILNPPQD